MDTKEFFQALNELERDQRISKESMIESLEAGLVSAYKKEFGESSPITVRLNEEKQKINVYAHKVVVEEQDDVEFDPETEILLKDAVRIDPKYKVGDVVIEDITPKDFSRIAAQTAKQVIIQRLNDMKKELIMSEMNERTNEIVSAVVRRKEGDNVFVEISLSQMEGIMMKNDQIPNEVYNINDVIRVYVKKIRDNARGGSQVIVSRSASGFVRKLFEAEVPEIKIGLIKIEAVVRQPGFRTKIAVRSDNPDIDAQGSCIGNKGVRVNAVVSELGGEKVDVIEYSDDPVEYIARALSPAQVLMVSVDKDEKSAKVVVPDEKLSLAIGKKGCNVSLASKITGYKIDVKPYSKFMGEDNEQ